MVNRGALWGVRAFVYAVNNTIAIAVQFTTVLVNFRTSRCSRATVTAIRYAVVVAINFTTTAIYDGTRCCSGAFVKTVNYAITIAVNFTSAIINDTAGSCATAVIFVVLHAISIGVTHCADCSANDEATRCTGHRRIKIICRSSGDTHGRTSCGTCTPLIVPAGLTRRSTCTEQQC